MSEPEPILDFLTSLGPVGWAVLGLAAIALVQLPRALREAWRRPWKDEKDKRP